MKVIITITLTIFLISPLLSSGLVKKINSPSVIKVNKSHKSKYTVEEATEILSDSRLGKINLNRDDHVYKCMKISQKSKDLEGATDVLIASNTNLGKKLDNEEVNLLINILIITFSILLARKDVFAW